MDGYVHSWGTILIFIRVRDGHSGRSLSECLCLRACAQPKQGDNHGDRGTRVRRRPIIAVGVVTHSISFLNYYTQSNGPVQ